MRWNALAGIPVFVWLFSPAPANACSCGWIGPPCEAAWNADVIFAGVVRSAEPMDAHESGQTRVRFDVQRAFVGADARHLEVSTSHGAACGVQFVVGTAYLVYARRSDTGELTASRCSRTRALAKADDDIRFLESLSRAPAGGRVYGQLRHTQREPWEQTRLDYGPLSDLAVSITGPGWFRETTSDADGKYELTGLPTGPMSIAVAAPHGFGQR